MRFFPNFIPAKLRLLQFRPIGKFSGIGSASRKIQRVRFLPKGGTTMTHKEPLLTAIHHEEPDRVAICAWYTPEAIGNVTEEASVDRLL